MTELKITPPPELVQQWWDDFNGAFYEFEAITATVFQAGADQELEACCEWLKEGWDEIRADKLRAARRPKPPSLKELALAALNEIEDRHAGPTIQEELIRRALEQLPDNN
jgi:hypothetical protein